jgi:hypothetical protein
VNDELNFENGIPSKESITKLYDEMDFQRATQAYIWATPAVQIEKQLGVGYGDATTPPSTRLPGATSFANVTGLSPSSAAGTRAIPEHLVGMNLRAVLWYS